MVLKQELIRVSVADVASYANTDIRVCAANIPDRVGLHVYFLSDLADGPIHLTKDTATPLPLMKVLLDTADQSDFVVLRLMLGQVQRVLEYVKSQQHVNLLRLIISEPVPSEKDGKVVVYCNLFATQV